MLARLRHHPVIGGDDQQREVNARRSCKHGVNETLVAGNVDEAKHVALLNRRIRVAKLDGNTASLFLGQPIGVHARQRSDKRRLAMVDVARGSDNHASSNRGWSLDSCATNATSSSRVRKSRMSASSAMRPSTGTGSARSAADSALSRFPVPFP